MIEDAAEMLLTHPRQRIRHRNAICRGSPFERPASNGSMELQAELSSSAELYSWFWGVRSSGSTSEGVEASQQPMFPIPSSQREFRRTVGRAYS
jgi:hypothetical protein